MSYVVTGFSAIFFVPKKQDTNLKLGLTMYIIYEEVLGREAKQFFFMINVNSYPRSTTAFSTNNFFLLMKHCTSIFF